MGSARSTLPQPHGAKQQPRSTSAKIDGNDFQACDGSSEMAGNRGEDTLPAGGSRILVKVGRAEGRLTAGRGCGE